MVLSAAPLFLAEAQCSPSLLPACGNLETHSRRDLVTNVLLAGERAPSDHPYHLEVFYGRSGGILRC